MHLLLLLLAGAAAAYVRCAMINCRRCTQSSSFPQVSEAVLPATAGALRAVEIVVAAVE